MLKPKILVVDDSDFNRKILINNLIDDYDILEASNGVEAINLINKNIASLSLVLLDIMMPELNGIEVLKILKQNGTLASIPVILITAADSNEAYGLQLGAVDFIAKPFDPKIVKTRVDTHIKLKDYRDRLEELIEYNMRSMDDVWDNAIDAFATVIEFRNLDLIDHTKKIKELTKRMLSKMMEKHGYDFTYSHEDRRAIISVMPLCDIGKICISESVLFKTDKLNKEEFEEIKKHCEFGSEIAVKFLNNSNNSNENYVRFCKDICLNHHENWDGTGYPNGLKKEEIPLSARIASLVDVYDALVSPRVYRNPYSHSEAVKIINRELGKKFDPSLVCIFLQIEKEIETIYSKNY